MPNSNFIKIYTGNFAIVKRIAMELDKIGISAVIKDQAESAILGGFGGSLAPDFQEVHVHQDEYTRALIVLNSITSDLED